MKLKKYIKKLNKVVEENPNALEYEVVYSSDSEGNSFNSVGWGPTIGFYSGDEDFVPEDNFEEWDYEEDIKPNAICIN